MDADSTHADDHPPFLAHHFDSPQQQFEAAKLGMWLFLATEFLLFGGLFCAYAVFRHNYPAMFHYGSQFLDTKLGAINTVILILSSLTMAMAVTASQLGRSRLMVGLLGLTFLGGAGFMGIKYVEYTHKFHDNTVWGTRFYVTPPHQEHEDEPQGLELAHAGDPDRGRPLFLATCRSCHGEHGEGIAGQGKDMRGSVFILERSEADLVTFVKRGRMPFDPLNTTGIQMPPKGGNPLLKDDQLRDIAAHVQLLAAASPPPPGSEEAEREAEPAFYIPRSSIPPAPPGPPGLLASQIVAVGADDELGHGPSALRATDPNRPPNAHIFFGIYFIMTGLHGLHVLAGMGVIAWLMIGGLRGRFGPEYFTPVDLGGLYWHVVDVIWIFLFPLLYLIG